MAKREDNNTNTIFLNELDELDKMEEQMMTEEMEKEIIRERMGEMGLSEEEAEINKEVDEWLEEMGKKKDDEIREILRNINIKQGKNKHEEVVQKNDVLSLRALDSRMLDSQILAEMENILKGVEEKGTGDLEGDLDSVFARLFPSVEDVRGKGINRSNPKCYEEYTTGIMLLNLLVSAKERREGKKEEGKEEERKETEKEIWLEWDNPNLPLYSHWVSIHISGILELDEEEIGLFASAINFFDGMIVEGEKEQTIISLEKEIYKL